MDFRPRSRRAPRSGRHRLRPNRCRMCEQLEDRTLLSQPGTDLASAIPLGVPLHSRPGAVAPGTPVFFQITSPADAHLVARVHAPGILTRIALLDIQGTALAQSDGQSATNPDDVIDQYVP